MSVNPIPDGFHTVTPYLIVKGAAEALEFYKSAFGATELGRYHGPGGSIVHAEFQIGDSKLMLGEECPQMGALAPQGGGTAIGLCIYVPNVDALAAQAVAAGAKVERPVQDQFYGDRSGTVTDPFGHKWTISTHIEDVSAEEMCRRMEEFTKKMSAA